MIYNNNKKAEDGMVDMTDSEQTLPLRKKRKGTAAFMFLRRRSAPHNPPGL
jgi:hypothetical protein